MTEKVLVIGGGPGGSTAAALLARNGVDVVLLEREHFPRYHIGESLASSCRVVLGLSGVVDKIDAQGYPAKRGALLRWGAEEDWTIDWSELFGTNVSSWQVERDHFDHILLDHAAEQGADVRQGATVRRVLFDGDRPYAAEWTDDDGVRHTEEFDHLVDASGRAGVLSARHFKNRRPHDIFRNVAIWGYWEGGTTLPNTPAGGIDVISHPEGWYWVIPLRDGVHSVGFVTHQDNFLQRRREFGSDEEMLLHVVRDSETVRDLMAGGVFQRPVRIEQDFSYVADAFCGPGFYEVGDAACFLDPLLSTGVHLALYSATLAAASILATARGDVTEREAAGFYETLYRNAYARLLVLVSGVYEQYQGKDSYFWLAQRMVREKERQAGEQANAAFVEIVAGLSDLRDARAAGGTAVMTELIEEADRARRRADEARPEGESSNLAALRIEPSDLHDTASGLYLVTKPLGIGRES
ncbi:NAD(P)/FAD-dependent oxidoreductase [Actinosynnema sp. CS-041913]|uniref:NAD(P)/FAD-dependent oxidoreductase n=1 Tax=Actinosynnema sp. CS-041913 TaxID=3239917 RepID=UPI003D932DEF